MKHARSIIQLAFLLFSVVAATEAKANHSDSTHVVVVSSTTHKSTQLGANHPGVLGVSHGHIGVQRVLPALVSPVVHNAKPEPAQSARKEETGHRNSRIYLVGMTCW